MQPTQRIFVLFALGLAACASASDPSNKRDRSTTTNTATTTDAATETTKRDSGADSVEICPLARPAEGTSCQATTSVCTYDEIECSCASGVWSCVEPVHPDCPASAPTPGSSCDLPEATECDFLQQECECLSGVWECESEVDGDAGQALDGGPDAGGGCPEARPAENTACEPSDVACNYESTQCVCPDGLWSCSEPVDVGCPSTPPLHGDPCAGFADCDFLEVECECRLGSWACKPND